MVMQYYIKNQRRYTRSTNYCHNHFKISYSKHGVLSCTHRL